MEKKTKKISFHLIDKFIILCIYIVIGQGDASGSIDAIQKNKN